jgi:hypothetical protein
MSRAGVLAGPVDGWLATVDRQAIAAGPSVDGPWMVGAGADAGHSQDFT